MHNRRAIDEYRTCFSYILLYDICSTALGLCCAVYQLGMVRITKKNKTISNLYSLSEKLANMDLSNCLFLVTFTIILNSQLFVPCYFGNEMILHGDELLKHAYFSNWMDMSTKSKKSFIYLRERLKCGNQILVGKMFSLSLETYTTVS